MSTSPEAGFDLEQLLLPDWAKESPQVNRYAKFDGPAEGREDRRDRRDRRDRPRRPDSPGRGPGPGPRGPRPFGPSGQGGQGRDRGRRGGPPGRGGPQGQERSGPGYRPAPPVEPLPEIQLALNPEEHAVDLLTKQIRITGRAFPLFDIALLVLAKPERHTVTLSIKKKPDGTAVQPLFLCALDESLWLSEDDAVRHVLDKHFATFYQPDRIKVDPPKGVYTFVAQCGLSGVVLGPPNYHDYQNQLRKVHQDRFARMPFEAFKSRVKIVKDEETVKKWVEEQSWKTEYLCLNLPDATKLPNRDEVEKHFRQIHLPNIIKAVETHRLAGAASRNLRDRNLLRLLRQRWEEQKRFPIQVATVLSQQFAARGLQFFKVNKTVTHVAVARPHYLDLEATPVSDGVRRIVEYISAHPKTTPRKLMEALAPRPPATPESTPPTPPTPESAAAAPAAPPEGSSAAAAPARAPVPAAPAEPTPEMAVVLTDLHWLVHQGHVIEFANGALETAKKPLPKPPPRPAPAPASPKQPAPAQGSRESLELAEPPPPVTATETMAPAEAAVVSTDPVSTDPASTDPASTNTPV